MNNPSIYNPQNMKVFEGFWTLDMTHSWIGVSIRYAGIIDLQACFHDANATILFDHEGTGLINAVIISDSLDTRNNYYNAKAQEADFLNIAESPVIQFQGTIQGDSAAGIMQLRGVLSNIVFSVQSISHVIDHNNEPRLGIEASATVSRQDYGMTWNDSLPNGELLLSDAIDIQLHTSFVRPQYQQKAERDTPVIFAYRRTTITTNML